MGETVYNRLVEVARRRGGCFLLLIDPDRMVESAYLRLAETAYECGVDALLVGTSLLTGTHFHSALERIKAKASVPVVLFPGSHAQLSPHADAVLFTSLLSGRNPQFLIDEQVKGAPLVRRFGLEPIPTGYLLIESGNLTSVQYISHTLPIPRDKTDIAAAHAMAAECLGMTLVYLEAGSGAKQPVSIEMVTVVATSVRIPVIVGGGLHQPEECAARVAAGAMGVVIGNHFEQDMSVNYLRELTSASHPVEAVTS